jgi:hypothetical protein
MCRVRHYFTVNEAQPSSADPVSVTSHRPPTPSDAQRKVHSLVALGLLSALRDQDLPGEVLDDENLTLTLPRRLGLSDAVDAQIRRYREDVRRRRRITDRELKDLVRLVIRRPDSYEVFLRVGADLHGGRRGAGVRRLLPTGLSLALARRRIRQRVRTLFGRILVKATGNPVTLEAVDDLLIRFDPGGDACAMITGLVRVELELSGVDPESFVHLECRANGGGRCRWGRKAAQEAP